MMTTTILEPQALTGFAPRLWEALHPRPERGPIYHSARHSLNALRVMERLAAGYFPGQEGFLGKVAGLHDIDPYREPGTPARVPATLEWMRGNRADLKRRFQWSDRQFDTGQAIIMRTEFPLDSAPCQDYRRMLCGLPPDQRAFALCAGAILSEYADKASWYLEDPRTAQAAVQGLVNEFENLGRHADMRSLDPCRFLSGIGSRDSFSFDDRLAGELGLEGLRLPLIDEVLSRLSPRESGNFKANIVRFRELREEWESVATQEAQYVTARHHHPHIGPVVDRRLRRSCGRGIDPSAPGHRAGHAGRQACPGRQALAQPA